MAPDDVDKDEYEEFDSHLEDEEMFDAHPHPGVEIGMHIQPDLGSGSFAENGRVEVAEDHVMMDGEKEALMGSYAKNGASEIGASYAEGGPHEIGSLYPLEGATEIGASYAEGGPHEIGMMESPLEKAATVAPFESFMLEPTRMGAEDDDQVGSHYPVEGAAEIGGLASAGDIAEIGSLYPVEGATEIGHGSYAEIGPHEIGAAGLYPVDGASEIGEAVARVVEKARDNRAPAPPMRAVPVHEERTTLEDWGVEDVVIGAAVASGGTDQFPILTELLQRCGSATEPRYVRVDTEESYKKFRAEHSPEMAELAQRVDELQAKIDGHMSDPYAHRLDADDQLAEDIADLTVMGAEVDAVEKDKRVELWMPQRFDGKLEAWREGDFVCASIMLPGQDGEVRICTSLEPIKKCVEEMSRHAAEAGVSPSTVVGVLPAMGCVLGAGTAIKEMAAAAPSILSRPEAADRHPFMVRIEPKSNPALAALAMLAWACRNGNQAACDEWKRLGEASPPAVKQAMQEALHLAKSAA